MCLTQEQEDAVDNKISRSYLFIYLLYLHVYIYIRKYPDFLPAFHLISYGALLMMAQPPLMFYHQSTHTRVIWAATNILPPTPTPPCNFVGPTKIAKLRINQVKARLIALLHEMVGEHQARRAEVTDAALAGFMAVRPLDF